MDDKGYVYGTIPATPGKENKPVIGLIAHMDTAEDASGDNIQAKIVEYQGGDILLNEEKNILMTEKEYPSLKKYVGQHLIVTDGTTLLGADDKAGIAEIMTMLERIQKEEIPHGKISVAFTPDEEAGSGVNHFNVKDFDAEFAYTMDGGPEGEIQYENFNACEAIVEIKGFNVHPGSSKDTMINAALVAMEFNAMLPSCETRAVPKDMKDCLSSL